MVEKFRGGGHEEVRLQLWFFSYTYRYSYLLGLVGRIRVSVSVRSLKLVKVSLPMVPNNLEVPNITLIVPNYNHNGN